MSAASMAAQWRNRIVGYEDVDPHALVANPKNWRTHPDQQRAALAGVLTEVGWVSEVLVNKRTGFVVDGHLRVAAAVARNEPSVPVRYVELTEDEERLVLATLDPLSALAGSDPDTLTALLAGLEPADEAVRNLLRDLTPLKQKHLNPDDADLTPPDEPITQPGDLWLLGEHRLLCGDATNQADWECVLEGQPAALCLTDPPYGIGLDYEVFVDSVANVAELAAVWLPLARRFTTNLVFTPGVTRQWLYPTPDWVMCWFYGGGQLRSPWGFNCWQPILAYGPDPSLASGNGCRPDAFDLNVPANSPDIDHPCPKPVALWAVLIRRLSFNPRDVIVDCFAGGGTTIVAAEETDHPARLLELNPAYCDVIVRRWERVSGRQAQQTHP